GNRRIGDVLFQGSGRRTPESASSDSPLPRMGPTAPAESLPATAVATGCSPPCTVSAWQASPMPCPLTTACSSPTCESCPPDGALLPLASRRRLNATSVLPRCSASSAYSAGCP